MIDVEVAALIQEWVVHVKVGLAVGIECSCAMGHHCY